MTDEQDKHFLRIVQDRLRMYSDLEREDIAKLMLMARRGMKLKNPDRLLVVNKAQAANIAFLDNEVDQLQFRLRAMVKRYDIDHPVRTADVHDPDCGCMRCERDRAETLLAKGGRL